MGQYFIGLLFHAKISKDKEVKDTNAFCGLYEFSYFACMKNSPDMNENELYEAIGTKTRLSNQF